ncbi:MAG: hypothetical protein V4688_06000 [Pseudomonadota bacterium]
MACALAITLLAGAICLGFTADDALISFRYGHNLVEHGVWNWNGDSRDLVEAYTNPIYTFLSIIPHSAGLNLLLFFKLLGALEIALVFAILWQASNRQLLPFLTVATFTTLNVVFFIHAFSGLETLLYFAAVLYVLTAPAAQLKSPAAASLILLAPLIRPEGALISLYLMFVIFSTKAPGTQQRDAQKWAVLFMLIGAGYFAVRYAYFGQLLPNTFYVKSGAGLQTLLYNIYIERNYLILVMLAYAWLAYRKVDLLFPTLQLAGYLLFNLTADLQMNYASRFSFQAVFPIIVYGFLLLLQSLDYAKLRRNIFLPLVLAATSLLLVSPKEMAALLTWYPFGLQSHAALGYKLADFKGKGYVLAVGDAGILPYLADWHTVDYIGLANRSIARHIHDGSKPVFPRPDVIVMYGATSDCEVRNMRFKGAEAFYAEVNLDDYFCAPGPRWSEYYFLHGLIRKDNPDHEKLANIFKETGLAAQRYSSARAMDDALHLRSALKLH